MNKANWRHLVLVRHIETSEHSDEAFEALKSLLDYVSNETLENFFEDYLVEAQEDDDSAGET